MKVLVYDGDCTLCVAVSARLVAWSGVPDAARRAHDAFDPETFARLAAAGIHDELAVIDEASGEIRSGVAGILWWLREGRFAGPAGFLDGRVGRAVLTPLYRTIAYNRRVLAPTPVRPIPCACDPGPHPGYHAALVAILAAVGGGGLALLSRGFAHALPALAGGEVPWRRAALLGLVPGLLAAWGATAAPARRRLLGAAERLWPLAVAGPAFAVGGALASLLAPPMAGVLATAGLLLGLLLLGRSVGRRRARRAGLS